MKCPNCSTENAEDARFCAECGRPLLPSTGSARQGGEKQTDPKSATKELASATEDATTGGLDLTFIATYWSFFLQKLKHPSSSDASDLTHALITLLLAPFIFFLSLMIMINHSVNQFIALITNRMYIPSSALPANVSLIKFDFVIRGTFSLALIFVLTALIIFLCLKAAGCAVSYVNVLTRMGTLHVPLLGLSVIALVLSFLSLYLYLFVFGLVLIAFQITFFLTLYSLADQPRFDPLYLGIAMQLICNIVMTIVLYAYIFEVITKISASNPF